MKPGEMVRRSFLLHALLAAIASLIIFLGCLSIAAQIAPALALSPALSGIQAMTCDLSLVFVASGVGMIAALLGSRLVTAAAAIAALVIGLAAATEYLVGLDSRMNQFARATLANV